MEATSACEIARLPEELLAVVISRTTPRDACRAATVSPSFRAAADSDAVWSCFLPAELPPLADGELQPAPPSKKAMFMRLSDGPILLASRRMSMWLDRGSGAKCYMLSAKALTIVWNRMLGNLRWIPLTNSRFAEAAELLAACWLEIRGKIQRQMLSQNTKYVVYMVFKMDDEYHGLDFPLHEAVVSIGGNRSIRQACLVGYYNVSEEGAPEQPIWPSAIGHVPPPEDYVQHPQRRTDDWIEVEMGEFFSEDADDGEVSFCFMETVGSHGTKGLIVHGIEIRAKK